MSVPSTEKYVHLVDASEKTNSNFHDTWHRIGGPAKDHRMLICQFLSQILSIRAHWLQTLAWLASRTTSFAKKDSFFDSPSDPNAMCACPEFKSSKTSRRTRCASKLEQEEHTSRLPQKSRTLIRIIRKSGNRRAISPTNLPIMEAFNMGMQQQLNRKMTPFCRHLKSFSTTKESAYMSNNPVTSHM